jgi:hypothetical protein
MDEKASSVIRFTSLDPGQDKLADWLWTLGFWGKKIVEEIEKAGLILPDELQKKFKKLHNLPFDIETQKILNILLVEMNGLCLPQEQAASKSWRYDTHCPCGRLYRLNLIHVQDEKIVKPLKIVFDERVQQMIGLSILHLY